MPPSLHPAPITEKNNERQLIWAKYVLKMCSMQLENRGKIYGPTQIQGCGRIGGVLPAWNPEIEINARGLAEFEFLLPGIAAL